jgi:hypothetical protein
MMDTTIQSARTPEDFADTRLGVQFVMHFNGLLKSFQLYPPGHTMLQQIMAKAYLEISRITAEKHRIQLHIFENKLYVFNQCLSGMSIPGVENVLRELQRRGIRQVMLHEQATAEEYQILIRLLMTSELELEVNGGAQEFMLQNNVQHIEVVEYFVPHTVSVDEGQLTELCSGKIFEFFVEDDRPPLSREELYQLYLAAQNPPLIVAFIREAIRVLHTVKKSPSTAIQLVLRLLGKMRDCIVAARLAEDQELRTLLCGVILAFDRATLYELLVLNAENELIRFAGALEYALQQLGPANIAVMISQQLNRENASQVMQSVVSVLSRLCKDGQALAAFLTVLKEKLDDSGFSESEAIVNQLAASFATQSIPDGDPTMALGSISTVEQEEIARGLESLKTITVNPAALQEWIRDYDLEFNYDFILRDLLNPDLAPDLFQKVLAELTERLQVTLENGIFIQAAVMVDFLAALVVADSAYSEAQKATTRESLHQIPSALWEKMILNAIDQRDSAGQELCFSQLRQLTGDSFFGRGLRLYLHEPAATRSQRLKTLLQQNMTQALQGNIEKLPVMETAAANRMLDLFELSPDGPINDSLWELTFHEDRQVAQRALKVSAQVRNAGSVVLLLEALNHPTLILRRLAIELLAQYKQENVALRLAGIALTDDRSLAVEINLQLRLSALESLKKIDEHLFRETLRILQKRRRFLFFAAEHQSIQAYIKKEMRK